MWKYRILGFAGFILSSLIYLTLRCRYHGAPGEHNRIYGLYHGQFWLLMFWFRVSGIINNAGKRICCLVSSHHDGEILNTMLTLIGMRNLRGSTRRDGAVSSLRGLAKKMKSGHSTIFALDGPVGPYHRIYPGAVSIAMITGKPIRMLFSHAESCWRFNSWDRFFLPKPFSRCHVYVSPDFTVDPNKSVDENQKAFREFINREDAAFREKLP